MVPISEILSLLRWLSWSIDQVLLLSHWLKILLSGIVFLYCFVFSFYFAFLFIYFRIRASMETQLLHCLRFWTLNKTTHLLISILLQLIHPGCLLFAHICCVVWKYKIYIRNIGCPLYYLEYFGISYWEYKMSVMLWWV